jgi:hypothetical protein
MFWITDQVVVDTFAGHSLFGAWNGLLAWVAILIDYLEVPVIVDTLRKVWRERDEIIARIRRNALGRRRAAAAAPKKAGTMPSRAA